MMPFRRSNNNNNNNNNNNSNNSNNSNNNDNNNDNSKDDNNYYSNNSTATTTNNNNKTTASQQATTTMTPCKPVDTHGATYSIACRPSISGMWKSISTTWNGLLLAIDACTAATAILPSTAVLHCAPARLSRRCPIIRIEFTSSTCTR